MVYVPERGQDAWDAHLISARVERDPTSLGASSFDACAMATTAEELLIDSV